MLAWLLALVGLVVGCSGETPGGEGGAAMVSSVLWAPARGARDADTGRLVVSKLRAGDARFTKQAGGAWRAVNAAQAIATTIGGRGARIDAADARFHLDLGLARFGRGSTRVGAADGEPTANGDRVFVARGAGVTEWWIADERGVEHGLDVATRPDGEGDLEIEVAVEGLIPVSESAGAVALLDGQGRRVLRYAELAVRDAAGRALPAEMRAEGARVALRIDDRAAEYPIVIDPLVTVPEGQMRPLIPGSDAGFGASVAVDATTNTVVVGAPEHSGSRNYQGAAYVYTISYPFPNGVGVPTLQAVLTASDPQVSARLGWSVAISGDTVVATAYSLPACYVFVRSGTTWTQQAKLTGGGDAAAISGDTLVLGSHNASNATVWVRSGATWTQQATLTGTGGVNDGNYGASVSISGNTVVVGASATIVAGVTTGVAYVYLRTGTTWGPAARLTAGDAGSMHRFGASVVVDGTTIAVGAPNHSTGKGAAYVFGRSGSSWVQQAQIYGNSASDSLGAAVALSGGTLVLGVPGAPGTSSPFPAGVGAAYVYTGGGAAWTYAGAFRSYVDVAGVGLGSAVAVNGTAAVVATAADLMGTATEGVTLFRVGTYPGGQGLDHDGDRMASCVAVSGTTAILGGPNALRPGQSLPQGAAAIFTRNLYNGGTLAQWEQQQELVSPDSGGRFGWSVAIDGNTAIVGTQRSTNGAAFVYTRTGTTWSLQQKLTPSSSSGADDFGWAVAISGDTALVGAISETVGATVNRGAVHVFTRSGSTWTERATVVASDGKSGDAFGASLAFDGTTAVIGTGTGPAYVVAGAGATWTEQAKLLAQKGVAPGTPVAVRGDTVLVNGPGAIVYVRSGTTWTQQAQLTTAGASALAYDGNVALVSDWYGPPTAVQVFVRNGATWTQQGTLSGVASALGFGESLALSSPYAVVGAPDTMLGYTPRDGAAHAFLLKGTPGATCGITTDCATSFSCVDGVCCASASCPACQACAAALQAPGGVSGACSPALANTDPHQDCPGQTCTGSTQENGHTCDGSGSCVPTSTTSCSPFACGATACKTTCTGDADCDAAHYCDAGQCVAKLAQGAACTAGNQCPSGTCTVDHVCCDQPCTGTCQACVLVATGQPDGTCAPVKLGLDPHGDCGTAACTGTTLTGNLCNGVGVCTAQPQTCGLYVCAADGKACLSACAADTDCIATAYCSGGVCTAQKAKGAACAADDECANNGVCVDGVCCNVPCTGQCEACDVAGHAGTCWPVPGGGQPHGERAPCLGSGDACAGSCDGTNAAACHYPGATQECGATCAEGLQTLSLCDGNGSCKVGTAAPCAGGYACEGSTKCKTSCASGADCAGGYACGGDQKCMPSGAKCTGDHTLEDADGQAHECSPYMCRGNACLTECTSIDDCVTPNICDSASKHCQAPSDDGTHESGCGCSLPGSAPDEPWSRAAAISLLLVAWGRRRRAGGVVRVSSVIGRE